MIIELAVRIRLNSLMKSAMLLVFVHQRLNCLDSQAVRPLIRQPDTQPPDFALHMINRILEYRLLSIKPCGPGNPMAQRYVKEFGFDRPDDTLYSIE
jgi:hypothetical protein